MVKIGAFRFVYLFVYYYIYISRHNCLYSALLGVENRVSLHISLAMSIRRVKLFKQNKTENTFKRNF